MGFLDMFANNPDMGAVQSPSAFSFGGTPQAAPQAIEPTFAQAPLPGNIEGLSQQTPATPQPKGFLSRLGDVLQSDEWGNLAADFGQLGGDANAWDDRRKQLDFERSQKVRKQAEEDMAAEAAAAQEASKGGGWKQDVYNRVYGSRSKRPYDPTRAKAYRDLNQPETGIAGDTPWTRAEDGTITWGEGAPISPKVQAQLDIKAEQQRQMDEYRDARLAQMEQALRLQQMLGPQRVGISQGQLDLARQREAREAAGGGGGLPHGIPPPPPGGKPRPPRGAMK